MSTDLTIATSRFPRAIRFVLVNNRVPRTDQHCALCGGILEKGYIRDSQTRLIYCDTRCFTGWAYATAPAQQSWKEGVMKCSNPECNRGIGLVAYRRGWFSKRPYCSKHCRDAFVADAPKLRQERNAPTHFEWLFLQSIENPQLRLKPAVVRTKAH